MSEDSPLPKRLLRFYDLLHVVVFDNERGTHFPHF
jgi:hypothetical protein